MGEGDRGSMAGGVDVVAMRQDAAPAGGLMTNGDGRAVRCDERRQRQCQWKSGDDGDSVKEWTPMMTVDDDGGGVDSRCLMIATSHCWRCRFWRQKMLNTDTGAGIPVTRTPAMGLASPSDDLPALGSRSRFHVEVVPPQRPLPDPR